MTKLDRSHTRSLKLFASLVIAVSFVLFLAFVLHRGPGQLRAAYPGLSSALTRGPYLQSVTTDSILVVWETDAPSESRVDYGLGPDLGLSVTSLTSVAHHHAVTLTNLLPYTQYHYQLVSGGSPLAPPSTFRTAAPATATRFSFAVFGDTRTDALAHQRVVSRVVALAPDLALHTGDLVATGANRAQWAEFFATEQHLLRRIPLFPVLGNHEGDHSNYFEVFHLPHNERWYSFDYGPVHFVALQIDGFAHWTSGSPQYQWLQRDLIASDARWKVVFFHIPPYSSGPHGDDPSVPALRHALPPLFARHGVNLVFNGHDHDYERSVVTDVTYVVAGAGGAPLYAPQTDNPHSIYFTSTHHAVSVTVRGDTLSAVGVRPDGHTFDPFTLTQPAHTAHRLVVGPGLYTFGAVGARLDLLNRGPLTALTVTVAHTRPRPQPQVRFLPRVYAVTTAGGPPYTATLALRYTEADLEAAHVASEEQLRLYRFSEFGCWEPCSSTVDTTANWITSVPVNQLSTWAIGVETDQVDVRLWLPLVLRPLPR